MKKTFLVFLTVTLLIAIFAACGRGCEDEGTGNPLATATAKPEETKEPIQDDVAVLTTKPTEVPEPTKAPEPTMTAKGIGNTPAALLKGGYFVYDNNVLYIADNHYISGRNSDGVTSQIVYSNDGAIGYLNIFGDYIYYMVDVNRKFLGTSKEDKCIYRKSLVSFDEPELVVSGVTDYGTGYGIRDGILYCTIKEKISPTKYKDYLCEIDLNGLQVISKEADTRFVAIAENALYQVSTNGDFICKYSGGEYSLGNIGGGINFLALPHYVNEWSFSIYQENFYYIDLVSKDVPCVMQVSPKGVEECKDLSTIGVEYGTDLYALDGKLYLNVGVFIRDSLGNIEGYRGVQYVRIDSDSKTYDFSNIEGFGILYVFDMSPIVIYESGGSIYWLNNMAHPEKAPCAMTDSWGFLAECEVIVGHIEQPYGMGFYVKSEPTSTPKPTATPAPTKDDSLDSVQAISKASIGDYVTFGTYEQDNNLGNGAEAIEWLVLEKKDGKALLLSKYALDAKPYNGERINVTWESCTLRSWINSDFYRTAFSEKERASIAETLVRNADNPEYGTEGGNDTRDKVFLLSIEEATTYFDSDPDAEDPARRAKVTEYAKAQGCYAYSEAEYGYYETTEYDGNGVWWLRSPGDDSRSAADVNVDGYVYRFGGYVDNDVNVVRPALWIAYE